MPVGIILIMLNHMGRPALIVGGTIPWAGDSELQKRESELADIYTCFLMVDDMWLTTLGPCCLDVLTIMDFALNCGHKWTPSFLGFFYQSIFIAVTGKETKLADLFQWSPGKAGIGKVRVAEVLGWLLQPHSLPPKRCLDKVWTECWRTWGNCSNGWKNKDVGPDWKL